MRYPAISACLALMLGSLAALALPGGAMPWLAALGVAAWQAALLALVAARAMLLIGAALASIALSAAAATQHAEWQRREAPIRTLVSDAGRGIAGVEPVTVEGVLAADASAAADRTVLRVDVERVRWGRGELRLPGTVVVSVSGAPDPARARTWTRGRRIRAPVLLRRPARYMNDGVADAERASLRRGVALTGSIKSAALVEVVARGPWWEERLAAARRRVRDAVARACGTDAGAAGVVTAILIGDRAGLPASVERQMQRAGTYHVIAISGGNVALFAALAWAVSRLLLRARRPALVVAMLIVAAYGLLVGAGASVGRAVAAALLFLCATLLDHRTPPLNVVAVVGVIFLLWDPLALTDLGFLLSFGATAGILLFVPSWITRTRARVAAGLLAATMAAEIALLPVQASAFQRLTLAGLALNFVAIPAMALVQLAGMAIVACDLAGAQALLTAAAAAARFGARALIDSAALVDAVPALTWRVAAPPAWLIGAYVAACALIAWRLHAGQAEWGSRATARVRLLGVSAAVAFVAACAIAVSEPERPPPPGWLRLTMFDVGQAEALAVRLPSGRVILIDAAGPADRFDIGDRVLVPALLARGATRLHAFALTHADVDHAGGALAVLTDLRPARVLTGVTPAMHRDSTLIADAARASGASLEALRAGGSLMLDGVLFKILHPPPPDWERQKVRNDDSLVIEILFGRVSMLLTGDAGAAVEPLIAAQLAPGAMRILKVGHHGSRTSTSAALLEAARPVAALISAGRGNFYGHPSREVLARLRGARAATFRTDEDGQIDVETDGRQAVIRTYTGRTWAIAAR